MNYPQGKGILIWQLKTCAGDNPSDLAGRAKAAGFAWVAIKVQDGVRIYQEEHLAEAINALKSNGIYVWGWGYLYGADWRRSSQARAEAQVTIQAVQKYQLSGFLMDVESPYKRQGSRSWATVYMATLRTALPDIPLGLSSYRYPSYHPELPWYEFLSRCNFHAPQVYWQGSHNPGYQLRRSVTELRALRDLPLVPVGAAYSERDWAPTEADLKEFNDTARELQLPRPGVVVLATCRERRRPLVYNQQFPLGTPTRATNHVNVRRTSRSPGKAGARAWLDVALCYFEPECNEGEGSRLPR